MRRSTIILIVAGAMLLASPATAKKPSPKPPPSSAPVAATLNADLYEVHEAGDVIWYDVTVQNKTLSPITATIEYPADSEVLTVGPMGVAEFPNLFSYEVTPDDVVADSDIVGSVTLTYDDGAVVAETSTGINPVDECVFEDEEGNPVVTESGLCIWKPEPTDTGLWTLSAVPELTRPTRVMMTMRDGVPGNWCTLQNGKGGVVQERWLPNSSTPIDLNVYLPASGECLLGGHGGCTDDDCYFAVGNPKSFYLYTTFDGFITLTPEN